MKKVLLSALLVAGIAGTMLSYGQTRKEDKKDTRAAVKTEKAEKKEAKGKTYKAAGKMERARVKENKGEKKEIKGK